MLMVYKIWITSKLLPIFHPITQAQNMDVSIDRDHSSFYPLARSSSPTYFPSVISFQYASCPLLPSLEKSSIPYERCTHIFNFKNRDMEFS